MQMDTKVSVCISQCDKEDLAKLSFTYTVSESFAKMRTPVLLVMGLFALNIASSLKICAFNVQSFGESKVNNKKVMAILLKVLMLNKCSYTRTELDN